MPGNDLVLQRHLRGVIGDLLGEDREDPLPKSGLAPAQEAAVDGLPGAELLREVAPGGAGPGDPEHAREGRAVVAVGPTDRGLLRGEERGDARPALVGEREIDRLEPLNGGTRRVGRPLPIPSPGVAALGRCLMAAAKGRPGKPEAEALRRLGAGEEQPPDFRHGQREQVCWPPLPSSFARPRVTAR